MKMTKQEWLTYIRKQADPECTAVKELKSDYKQKAAEINKRVSALKNTMVKNAIVTSQKEKWDNITLLDQILLITYVSNIVMLELRNRFWKYDYMAFARRIGELWEPFCKLSFQYPINELSLINPPIFLEVQQSIKEKAIEYIDNLNIADDAKQELKSYFNIPWSLVDSGGIKLSLDLHFAQNGINYNCDFKSGFSSNEKGNTNRLLLVASIYHSLSASEKLILFVRQGEDENNHYLLTLKNSPYWDVFCADDAYSVMSKYTGFDLRKWLDLNANWSADIAQDLLEHLREHDLLKYLTW